MNRKIIRINPPTYRKIIRVRVPDSFEFECMMRHGSRSKIIKIPPEYEALAERFFQCKVRVKIEKVTPSEIYTLMEKTPEQIKSLEGANPIIMK